MNGARGDKANRFWARPIWLPPVNDLRFRTSCNPWCHPYGLRSPSQTIGQTDSRSDRAVDRFSRNWTSGSRNRSPRFQRTAVRVSVSRVKFLWIKPIHVDLLSAVWQNRRYTPRAWSTSHLQNARPLIRSGPRAYAGRAAVSEPIVHGTLAAAPACVLNPGSPFVLPKRFVRPPILRNVVESQRPTAARCRRLS